MSQNSKISFSASSLCVSIKLASALTIGLVVLATASANAQNQFVPPANFQQPDLGSWTPPNTAGSFYQNKTASQTGSQTSFNATVAQPPTVSFPESVTPFETGIRTANFEAPAVDLQTDPSITDRIDGAAATLSKWKDIAGEKASTLLSGVKQDGNWLDKLKSMVGSSDISKMLGSLALVLGLYFAFVWVMRKFNLGGNSGLPPEIVEVMGQVPFGSKRSLQLVRLGSKMLLLLNSPDGTQPLGEITDPNEVEHLASLCQSKRRSRSSRPTVAVQQAAARLTGNTPQPTSNVGATNLNDVVRILQQAAKPSPTVFEA